MTRSSAPPQTARPNLLGQVALRTSAIYWMAAVVWILFSDAALVALVSDRATVNLMQTYKGWAFVTVTAILLYLALRGQLRHWHEESAARLQAEQTLQQSEERYRATFDRAPVGLAHVGLDGRWLRFNDAVCRITGYPREELAELTFGDITHPDDLEEDWLLARKVLSGEIATYAMEKRYIRKGGDVIWVHLTVAMLRDAAGAPMNFLSIIEDVSERKWAEDALRGSEERYRLLFEQMDEGFCTLEVLFDAARRPVDFRFLVVNPAFERQTGIKDAAGRRMREFAPKHEEHWFELMGKVVTTGESVRYENVAAALQRTYEVHAFRLGSAADRTVAVLFNDITERKEADEKLRLSEEMFSAAFANNPAAIALTRFEDGLVMHVNDTWVDMTGYGREEMIGRTVRHLWPTPEDARRFLDELTGKGILRGWEQAFRKKSGESFLAQISAQVLVMHGEKLILSTLVDITARKKAEEDLRALAATLERRVEERTRELAAARDAADQANRAKSQFLANMSHEIRTPLNAITGMAHLIRRGGLTAKQEGQLDKLEVASRHLLGVINAVLELSRIEAGKFSVDQREIHVGALMANVISLLQESANAKHLRLHSDIAPLPAPLLGDTTRLQQALLNYASNAVKFTEAGEVSLTVRCLEEDADSALLRFEVADTGIGIAPHVLPRLFAAFEQADNGLTRKYGGTGLGLAITRKIAEHMGGEAGAESIPGKGSRFWFTARLQKGRLPAAAASIPAAQAETRLEQDYAGARLLLVEDEPVNRHIVQAMLEGVGLVVDVADNGAAALQLAAGRDYALVLMDMQMPEMDGLEATLQLRQLPAHRHTPVIALTANAFAEDKERCLRAGMNDFLSKPVEHEVFYATLLDWLSRPADSRT